ncbi:unnamed protein product [Arabis nemorensis]|uniref:BZIP domain-containing protein n=1 Tax=Arabis nemorensis TaxID=586526 RepID=A0A565BFB4_9BRAS|nr:unnamed protein product [Arabis nemorensis]
MPNSSLLVPTSSFQVSNGRNQNEEKKVGYFDFEVDPGFTVRLRQDTDLAMDPKKLKRSRWKKRQYIEYLEKKTKELEMEVSVRRARLEMLNEMTECLTIEHRELEELAFATNQRCISAQAENEALIVKLREAGDEIGLFDLDTLMHLLL